MKKSVSFFIAFSTFLFVACEQKEEINAIESIEEVNPTTGIIDPTTPASAFTKHLREGDEALLKAAPSNIGQFNLVFSDEFNGTSLDLNKWNYHYPWGQSHNHSAWMAEENVNVTNGSLVITAKTERHPDAPYSVQQGGQTRVLNYQAGAVNTKNKFGFTYGLMEARVKSTRPRGTWPAFWTLNTTGEWPPEIDILEIPISSDNAHKVHHYYYHYGPNWQNEASFGSNRNNGVDLSAGYHTYGCEWGPDYMRFYFDGSQIAEYTGKDVCKQGFDMFLLLNLAVGGWGGSVTNPADYPDDYKIDWVRVYQKQYFVIKNQHTGKCLRVLNGGTSEGDNVVTYDQHNDWQSEHWTFPWKNGNRLIQSRISGRVLRPFDGNNANNTNIVITKNQNWSSQEWILEDAGNGFYFIKNILTNKYLRPYEGQSTNNTNLVIYDYNNWSSMKWELIPVN